MVMKKNETTVVIFCNLFYQYNSSLVLNKLITKYFWLHDQVVANLPTVTMTSIINSLWYEKDVERVLVIKSLCLYSLTSLIQHSFIQHSKYYDTTFARPNFYFKIPSFIQLRHLIMRHLESPFCHIKEVVNAKFFPSMLCTSKIHPFHLGTTWELHLSLGT